MYKTQKHNGNSRIKYRENRSAPIEDNTKTPVLLRMPGIKDQINVVTKNRAKAANKTPPNIVKSHFVCNANIVRATTTTVVTRMASMTYV